MKRMILVAFEEFLEVALGNLNLNEINICSVVTVNTNTTSTILKHWDLKCPIFSYDYLFDCVCNTYFDYIAICGMEDIVKKDLYSLGIEKNRIIDLRILRISDMTSLSNLIKKYLHTKDRYELFITGSSYAYKGTEIKAYNRNTINFAASSQDLYYDYEIMKYIFEKKPGDFKTGIIGIAPWSFHYDLSRSNVDWHVLSYYPILKDEHNFSLSAEEIENIFNANYLSFYDELKEPFDVDFEDRLNDKKATNYSIRLQDILEGRERAESWNEKNFPVTVAENKCIFEKYICLCKKNGIDPVVVVYPTTDIYHRWFSKKKIDEFYFIIKILKEEYDFVFLDFFRGEGFSYNDFHDVDHLNRMGATKISSMIDKYISRL